MSLQLLTCKKKKNLYTFLDLLASHCALSLGKYDTVYPTFSASDKQFGSAVTHHSPVSPKSHFKLKI